MNNIKKKFLVFSVFLFSFLFLSQFVFIQNVSSTNAATSTIWDQQEVLKEIGNSAFDASAGEPATIGTVIAKVIKIALGLLGVIFVVLLVISGFKYMTAGGNEEQITKSLDTIKHAVIGLIIVIMSYAITYFVFKTL
ncbi:MAG: pilin [Patescibacteria group bacterium]|nr:pilin [Patescibacteria group bacterium]MBU1160699.1 pilin [Patescibacteria group bacterium]MBU1349501.1 pilin [Patescibacteria group bacterium]MBU2415968.1 pilin [Patescibacteria group bacterium]MBU2474783.1 pilin [Patescibacteria group bacterium]